MYVCMYVCMYVHTYICMYIYIYTYIHIYSPTSGNLRDDPRVSDSSCEAMSEIARRSKTPRKSVGHAASSRPNSCSPVVTRSSPRNFTIFHCRSPGVAGRNCVSCFVSSEAMLRPTTLRHAELRSTIDSITSALFYDFLCPIVEERLAISAQSVHRCKARLVGYNFFADCTGRPSFV